MLRRRRFPGRTAAPSAPELSVFFPAPNPHTLVYTTPYILPPREGSTPHGQDPALPKGLGAQPESPVRPDGRALAHRQPRARPPRPRRPRRQPTSRYAIYPTCTQTISRYRNARCQPINSHESANGGSRRCRIGTWCFKTELENGTNVPCWTIRGSLSVLPLDLIRNQYHLKIT
jgi:hypothetical protein